MFYLFSFTQLNSLSVMSVLDFLFEIHSPVAFIKYFVLLGGWILPKSLVSVNQDAKMASLRLIQRI